jgi:hypothetical protein
MRSPFGIKSRRRACAVSGKASPWPKNGPCNESDFRGVSVLLRQPDLPGFAGTPARPNQAGFVFLGFVSPNRRESSRRPPESACSRFASMRGADSHSGQPPAFSGVSRRRSFPPERRGRLRHAHMALANVKKFCSNIAKSLPPITAIALRRHGITNVPDMAV